MTTTRINKYYYTPFIVMNKQHENDKKETNKSLTELIDSITYFTYLGSFIYTSTKSLKYFIDYSIEKYIEINPVQTDKIIETVTKYDGYINHNLGGAIIYGVFALTFATLTLNHILKSYCNKSDKK